MTRLAIIGGTGLTSLSVLQITQRKMVTTPYGEPSGPLSIGKVSDKEVLFLPRHGQGHTIPPHRINYRANIWALKRMGVECVIAVAAVGGIHSDMAPGSLVIPNQIIDYTWGRGHTMFESDLEQVVHVDFTAPYCPLLRSQLLAAGAETGLELADAGTYGATQGPRLETAAEIRRMEQDGCDVVGMTGMPEAALARELELSYATCAVVANWAAGKTEGPITMEQIRAALNGGMEKVRTLLGAVIPMVC